MEGQVQSHGSVHDNTKNSRIKYAETGIDMISELPDSLIVQILSLMPTKDAFKTCILSKRWQYLWTFVDNLNFVCDGKKEDEFVSFVDNVLRLHRCAVIKKFHLVYISDDEGERDNSKLDKWLEIVVNKKVDYLDLTMEKYDEDRNKELYCLPQILCSSSSLRNLKCKHGRISEDCVINWTSLKSLTLECFDLSDEDIVKITSNCPQLESLELRECLGFQSLHMASPKCRTLLLMGHCGKDFEIVAPYVQHLKISDDLQESETRLRDVSSLVHAELTFVNMDLYIGEYPEMIVDMAKDLLQSVLHANELTIRSWFVEAVLALHKQRYSFPLLECKRLTILSDVSMYAFLGIGCLLKLTPHLETLRIFSQEEQSLAEHYDAIHLVGDKDYRISKKNIYNKSLHNLKDVIISYCRCSKKSKMGRTKLFELVEYLVEHANVRQKLVITRKKCKECSICYIRC